MIVILILDGAGTTGMTISPSAEIGKRCSWKKHRQKDEGAGTKAKTGVADGAKAVVEAAIMR